MADDKHTPGPWEWAEDKLRDGWSGLFDANGSPVVYPQRCNEGDDGAAWFGDYEAGDEELKRADRCLIAAAPDLYGAADVAYKAIKARKGFADWGGAEAIELLGAALRKARGEMQE